MGVVHDAAVPGASTASSGRVTGVWLPTTSMVSSDVGAPATPVRSVWVPAAGAAVPRTRDVPESWNGVRRPTGNVLLAA